MLIETAGGVMEVEVVQVVGFFFLLKGGLTENECERDCNTRQNRQHSKQQALYTFHDFLQNLFPLKI